MASHSRTRETQQRRAVYDALKGTTNHPTADWIFERVRESMPKISLGTVYRNLSVLKQEGLVRELHGTDRRAHYDADTSIHGHFFCSACGEVRDIEGLDGKLWKSLKDLVGCEITEQRVEFVGLCPGCARRRRSRSPFEA